ncbi:hypothetical protein FDECE_15315, partial [Fusarium decemcellulare]
MLCSGFESMPLPILHGESQLLTVFIWSKPSQTKAQGFRPDNMRLIWVLASGFSGASAILAPRSPTKAPYHVPEGFELAENEYIVKLRDDHNLEDHFANTGLNLTEAATFTPFQVINAYHLTVRDEDSHLIHEIRHDPGVEYIHHDYYPRDTIPELSDTIEREEFKKEDASSRKGKRWNRQIWARLSSWNMAMVNNGWTLPQIGYPEDRERLDLGTDLEKEHMTYWKYHPGAGVNIYVFDSGVRLSHDVFHRYTGLAPKVRNFGDLKPTDQSPYCPDGHTMGIKDDDVGHGTLVAGIAAGSANSTAFDAHIVNVKVYCNAKASQKAAAVDAVVAEHNKFKQNPVSPPMQSKEMGEELTRPEQPWDGWRGSVINWSLDSGIPPSDDILQVALQKAADTGIPIAAAAGNSDETRLTIPARYKSTMSVGAVNIQYNRWTRPRIGILPPSGSNHNRRLDVFAPGEKIRSSNIKCNDCYSRENGTSMATPHVAGVMAIMVDYEGWENLDNAEKIYERIRANMLRHVNVDDAMKKAGTTRNLLSSGITRHQEHPYDRHPYQGIPEGEQVPADNTPWGPGGIPNKRRRQYRRQDDDTEKSDDTNDRNWSNIPQQIVDSIDADKLMQDGDDSDYKPPEPDSSACFGLQTNHYVLRDPMVANIEDFCKNAQALARPDDGSKFITAKYNENTPNEVMLMIEYETPDLDYEVLEQDCIFYLKDVVLDRCDSSSQDNPGNWKAGGAAVKDKVAYRMEPLKERKTWAACKVDDRKVYVWGGGWSTTDSGKKFIDEAGKCGIESPKFSYGGGDDNREWTAEMNGKNDVDAKCISEAIDRAGGGKDIG